MKMRHQKCIILLSSCDLAIVLEVAQIMFKNKMEEPVYFVKQTLLAHVQNEISHYYGKSFDV